MRYRFSRVAWCECWHTFICARVSFANKAASCRNKQAAGYNICIQYVYICCVMMVTKWARWWRLSSSLQGGTGLLNVPKIEIVIMIMIMTKGRTVRYVEEGGCMLGLV